MRTIYTALNFAIDQEIETVIFDLVPEQSPHPVLSIRHSCQENGGNILYFGDVAYWDAISFQIRGANNGNSNPRLTMVFDDGTEYSKKWHFAPNELKNTNELTIYSFDDAGNLSLGTGALKVNADGSVIITTGNPPATSTSPGVTGRIEFDSNYIYRCVATDSWKRSALSTW